MLYRASLCRQKKKDSFRFEKGEKKKCLVIKSFPVLDDFSLLLFASLENRNSSAALSLFPVTASNLLPVRKNALQRGKEAKGNVALENKSLSVFSLAHESGLSICS